MTRYFHFATLLSLLLCAAAWAQKAPDQRRLLRIESRVYGWYGVAEPEFDKTIGRRELFKINAGEQFLKGLDGRLVILQGRFSDGQLELGSLAPPPITVPESSRRQRFTTDGSQSATGVLTSSDGYRLRFNDPALSGTGSMSVDLVVAPLGGSELQVVGVLSAAPATSAAVAIPTAAATPTALATPTAAVTPTAAATSTAAAPTAIPSNVPLSSGALLELEMTQAFVDGMVDLGRDQAGLKADLQGVTLQASHLRVLLPDGAGRAEDPWRLEGTVELGYLGMGSLAESSFVISAKPLIVNNVLMLQPNWDEINMEGQLPFNFLLTPRMLGQLKAYLPQQVPVMNLDWITSYLRGQGLVGADEQADWFLGGGGTGTVRLGLGPAGTQLAAASPTLTPGNFRLQFSAPVADRLVRRGVQTFLNPDQPFVPDPPITVGKVLFVSIKVEQIFLRSLQSGYSNGVFRFKDLVVDVAWRAGPLNGVEPLLSASGFIRPRLSAPQPDGTRYWDWDTVIEALTIRSDKMPGDKTELAAELIPRLERELGSELAQKQKVPAILPLAAFLQTPSAANSYLEITELRPLDALLELEGRLIR